MRRFINRGLETVKQIAPSIFSKTEELQFKLIAPSNTPKAKVPTKIELPRNKYVNLQAYLQKFYNSTSQNGRVNGQHLTLVVGAHRSGKTSLIKQSLKQFRRRKASKAFSKKNNEIPFTTLSTPESLEDAERQTQLDNQFSLTIEFDFSEKRLMKSEAFFHHLQEQIIKNIIKIDKEVKSKTNTPLLDAQIIKQIAISHNAINYVFIAFKDVLYSILNDCDGIKFNQQGLNKLEELNERIIQVNCNQFFGKAAQDELQNKVSNTKQQKSLFHETIELVMKEKGLTELQASLRLFLSVFKRIEYEHRPQIYITRSYQSGIQTTQFLFSILNYLCGFGNLNKQTLATFIQTNTNPYEKYYIGKGNHIDVVLAFMHLQNLSCYNNSKFLTWFDNMLIRLHNASNLRSHFPVLVELPDCQALTRLQNCGRMQLDNPTILEIPGYFVTNMFKYSPGLVFNNKALHALRPVLGRNPSTWNQAIQQLAKGTPMSDILEGRASFMLKNKSQFANKINRLYLNPENLPYIDNNSLRFHILEHLHMISQCNGFMKTLYLYHNMQIFNGPLFNQLYRNKLAYQYYYNTAVDLTDMCDLLHIKQYLKNLSTSDKIKYSLWRRFENPYIYFVRELRYCDRIEKEQWKKQSQLTQRTDYHLREYYGQLNDYKIQHYERVLKSKYNV